MEKKILIILLCGLLAVWPCIPALATEEETTADWNIFEEVDTLVSQTVTDVSQGMEILSKYVATTTEYAGVAFQELVSQAVDLWQTADYYTSITMKFITNGGPLDYVVEFDAPFLDALKELLDSNTTSEGPSNININGKAWYYVAPGSTVTITVGSFTPACYNPSDSDYYFTTIDNGLVACSWTVYDRSNVQYIALSYNGSSFSSGYGSYTYNNVKYFANLQTWSSSYAGWSGSYSNYAAAMIDFYGYEIPESENIVVENTPRDIITSQGIGSTNWSNVSVDEGDTYNNIENVYNYITYTGQQLDEASVDQMAAEGATLANIDYSVPNVNYDYTFISAAFAILPEEFKGIILLGIVLLVCSILFGFGHGGVK